MLNKIRRAIAYIVGSYKELVWIINYFIDEYKDYRKNKPLEEERARKFAEEEARKIHEENERRDKEIDDTATLTYNKETGMYEYRVTATYEGVTKTFICVDDEEGWCRTRGSLVRMSAKRYGAYGAFNPEEVEV